MHVANGGTPTFYVFDGANVVGKVQASGNGANVTAAYTWGANGLVSERLFDSGGSVGISSNGGAGRSLWYAFDVQGATRALTDSAGAVADTYQYLPFGAPLTRTGTDANPFQYGGQAGYYTDASNPTGTVLCGLRWYDPYLGRWLSRDPIGYKGGENLYAYCDNNPVMCLDPSGTDKIVSVFGDNHGVPFSFAGYFLSMPEPNRLTGSIQVTYLDHPSKTEVLDALVDADTFYFGGHGGIASGGVYVNIKERITPADMKALMDRRKKKGFGKFHVIDLHVTCTP